MDLADLRGKAAARKAADVAAADAEQRAAQQSYSSEHTGLSQQLDAARRQLVAAREEAANASGECWGGTRLRHSDVDSGSSPGRRACSTWVRGTLPSATLTECTFVYM